MYQWRGLGDVGAAQSVQGLIKTTAAQYGVPDSLALAVAERESGFNQAARGAAGEIGVFQLMPSTAAGLGVDPYDLRQNVEGGIRYLSQMRAQFGDWFTALEAYNGGPGNVARGTVSGAAQAYAAAVLAASGISATAVDPAPFSDSDSSGPLLGGDVLSGVPLIGGLSTPAKVGLALLGGALLLSVVSD